MDDELDVQFKKKNVVVILLMINLWYWKDLQRIFFLAKHRINNEKSKWKKKKKMNDKDVVFEFR